MPRSKTGQAISPERKTAEELGRLQALRSEAEGKGDLGTWRRAQAVLEYISGKPAFGVAQALGVTRGAVNRWLVWYQARGADGLRTGKAPGAPRRLSLAQREELTTIIEEGPQAAGYMSGVWTGPMIGDLIESRFGVRYHNHYVPVLLHELGFSVQRPRKRLARADAEAQAVWVNERFPAIKKKPRRAAES